MAVIMMTLLTISLVMFDCTHLFPVTLTAKWQANAESALSPTLKSWLFDSGSLTARLKAHCHHFEVVVIGQAEQVCSEQEACEFIPAGEPMLVREVLLLCDGKPQVFARSLMPLSTLTGDEAFLGELGNMPLGQAIFNSPYLTRGEFSVAKFNQQSAVGQLAEQLSLPTQESLWGRRSIFFLHDKPLAVAEVFLPQAVAYQAMEASA